MSRSHFNFTKILLAKDEPTDCKQTIEILLFYKVIHQYDPVLHFKMGAHFTDYKNARLSQSFHCILVSELFDTLRTVGHAVVNWCTRS